MSRSASTETDLTFAGEEFIPFPAELGLVLFDDFFGIAQFGYFQIFRLGEPHGTEPKLCGAVAFVSVNMRWFIAFLRVEVKGETLLPMNGRHMAKSKHQRGVEQGSSSSSLATALSPKLCCASAAAGQASHHNQPRRSGASKILASPVRDEWFEIGLIDRGQARLAQNGRRCN